jgi:hypothetical protein
MYGSTPRRVLWPNRDSPSTPHYSHQLLDYKNMQENMVGCRAVRGALPGKMNCVLSQQVTCVPQGSHQEISCASFVPQPLKYTVYFYHWKYHWTSVNTCYFALTFTWSKNNYITCVSKDYLDLDKFCACQCIFWTHNRLNWDLDISTRSQESSIIKIAEVEVVLRDFKTRLQLQRIIEK